jgi:predicted dehydrogenase
MTIAVLGYGLIGKERVKALHDLHRRGFPVERVLVFDPQVFQAKGPLLPEIATAISSLEQVLSCNPSLVIVATPHDAAVKLLHEILPSSTRVLVEKPLGRCLEEAFSIASKISSDDHLLVGFNYRFFPGIRQAIRDALLGQAKDVILDPIFQAEDQRPGLDCFGCERFLGFKKSRTTVLENLG